MNESEIKYAVKEIGTVFKLTDREQDKLCEDWLFPVHELIQSITMDDDTYLVVHLIYDFYFFINVKSNYCNSRLFLLPGIINYEVILSICQYFFWHKGLNSLMTKEQEFILALNNLQEQELLQLSDCLNNFATLNATFKQSYLTIQIFCNDLINTTISIDLDSQHIKEKIISATNFLTHYKKFLMIEKLTNSNSL